MKQINDFLIWCLVALLSAAAGFGALTLIIEIVARYAPYLPTVLPIQAMWLASWGLGISICFLVFAALYVIHKLWGEVASGVVVVILVWVLCIRGSFLYGAMHTPLGRIIPLPLLLGLSGAAWTYIFGWFLLRQPSSGPDMPAAAVITPQDKERLHQQKQYELAESQFSAIVGASKLTDFIYCDERWLKEKYLQFAEGLRMELKRISLRPKGELNAAFFDIVDIKAALEATYAYERLETGLAIKLEQVVRKLFAEGVVHIEAEHRPSLPAADQDLRTWLGGFFDHFRLGAPMNPTARLARLEAAAATLALSRLPRNHYMLIEGDFRVVRKGNKYILTHKHAYAEVNSTPVLITGSIPRSEIIKGNDVLFAAPDTTLKLTVLGIIVTNGVTSYHGKPGIDLLIKVVQL